MENLTKTKKCIATIHQPNLFPRLKVLQKIASCDIYIIYDDVQFVRNDWQNRVLIRNYKTKESFWLVIPVNKPNGQKSLINEVQMVEVQKTSKLMYKQIASSYRASPYWSELNPFVQETLSFMNNSESVYLNDFLFKAMDLLLYWLEVDIRTVRSSDILIEKPKEKNLRLIELCKYFHADSYICGSGGLNYIDANVFKDHSINVIIQNWKEEVIRSFYEDLEWKNFSYLDFWARYGINKLRLEIRRKIS